MALSKQRKAKILEHLSAKNPIKRWWSGSNNSGRLRHWLDGVGVIREAECSELRKEGLITVDKRELVAFKSYIPADNGH